MPSHSLTRIHRRTRAALLTLLVALLTPAASAAEWRLWPSPYDGAETIDQSQTTSDGPGGPAFVVYQRWTGETSADESRWFDTLLLPHGPELSPADAAARVRVLLADAERVAFEMKVGDETWTILDQPQGGMIDVPGLSSDAGYAIARSAPDRPPYLLTHAATRVEVGDFSYRWPVRTSVELGGSTPPDRIGKAVGRSHKVPH